MKKAINSLWGLIPLGIVLILGGVLLVITKTSDNTLRVLPRNILIIVGALSSV